MPPSASKQKRLAEKAAKGSVKAAKGGSSTGTPIDTGSANDSGVNTPLTSVPGSLNVSSEDLTSMAKLRIATDRCVSAFIHRATVFTAFTAGIQERGGCAGVRCARAGHQD